MQSLHWLPVDKTNVNKSCTFVVQLIKCFVTLLKDGLLLSIPRYIQSALKGLMMAFFANNPALDNLSGHYLSHYSNIIKRAGMVRDRIPMIPSGTLQ